MKNWLENKITLHTYDDVNAERENAITHFIGTGLAVIGLLYLLFNLNKANSTTLKVGLIIFALTNILLYFASAMYHQLKPSNLKRIFRILDHSNIYFLIAGTYTPILLSLNNNIGMYLTILIWSIAALGICFTLIFWGKLKPFHVVLYLAMGWTLIFFWNDIIPFLPSGLIYYLLLGGITYTIGVAFYAIKKIPHYHGIWHIFVLGGSIWFYIGICSKLL